MENGKWRGEVRRWKGETGQASAGGVMFTIIVVLIAAILVDVFHLMEVRDFAYSLAADAALTGTSLGRDYSAYYKPPHRGELRLNPGWAQSQARQVVQEGMDERGISHSDYSVRIEVIPDITGGTVPSFPPVPRASLGGISDWTTDRPAVGVYLTVDVDTNLFGLVNGGQPVTVHAFQAVNVTEVQP